MRMDRNDMGLGVAYAWWANSLKLWEIAVGSPQVIALRTVQLAAAPYGAPGAREAVTMGTEKAAAVFTAWQAMMAQGLQMQEQLLQQALGQWRLWAVSATRGGRARPDTFRATVVPVATSFSGPMAHTAARVASAGIAPVHRRVTGNLRRLSAPKKRG